MRWPRDGADCPTGEGIYARIKALPPAHVPERVVAMIPWRTRLRVWLWPSWRPRRRGTRVA